MGLIGYLLYYDEDYYYNNDLDNLLNIYDNSNIIQYNRLQFYSNNVNKFVILNDNYYEFKNFVDNFDLSINITTMENINIHIPSDICNNKFTYNYEKIEKKFNINLTYEELSQTDISRIIIYNNPIDKFFNENLSKTQQNDYNSFYINNNNTKKFQNRHGAFAIYRSFFCNSYCFFCISIIIFRFFFNWI